MKPVIQIILRKDGKKLYRYPNSRKMIYFAKNKANSFLKKGYSIDVVVRYKPGFYNIKKNCTISDILWCKERFVEEYL